MGEMRLEVIVDGGVQRMEEGTLSMVTGRLLSLFKVCGLSAICVADSGRVDVWGE